MLIRWSSRPGRNRRILEPVSRAPKRPTRRPHRLAWRPQKALPEEFIARLGKDSDARIAHQGGVSLQFVRKLRRSLGIPPSVIRRPEAFRWTPERVRMLGAASDAAVAKRFGISLWRVVYKRTAEGIPPKRRGNSPRHWTEREIRLLRERSDIEVGHLLGISWRAVRSKRRQLGIASKAHRAIEWTAAMLALVGKRPDAEVAKALHLLKGAVAKKRRELGLPSPRSARQPSRREEVDTGGTSLVERLARRFGIENASAEIVSIGEPSGRRANEGHAR